MCLLSCNLNFIHHYWQQSITHIETNLPLRLAGKAQLFSCFRTTTIPDGYENTERHTFSEYYVDITRVRSKSAFLNAVANNFKTPGKFVYTRQFKRVGQIVLKFKRTQIHFISDVSTTVVVFLQ